MTRLGPGAEFDLIRRFLALDPSDRHSPELLVGAGDDAAVIGAHPLAVSADLSIEGVHFRRDWLEPEEIGWRAASAGLSDLAAMVAQPIGVLASLAVTTTDARQLAQRVMEGVTAAAQAAGARLLGGDLTRSPGPLVLDIVVLGEVSHPLRRDGARPGDEVWVTGRLGGAAVAVRDWTSGRRPEPAARARFARPVARTHEALWLRQRVDMTAGLDLSDGLAGDVPHLAAASRVGIVIERDLVPVHDAAASAPELALTGGEEYELCLVSPQGALEDVASAFEAEFAIPLTRIGTVVEREGDEGEVWLRNQDGSVEPMPVPSYRHFEGRE